MCKEALLWHPDKVLQAFGAKMRVNHKDAIMARVTEVSKAVIKLWAMNK